MDVITPSNENPELHEELSKAEVLAQLEPLVEEMMAKHLHKRRLWMSSDFLPADEAYDDDHEKNLMQLRERARGVSDAVRVSVVVGLLTEEGLPHFHRIIAKHLGEDSFWSKWNGMWTAEEDRHGNILRDYARDARLFRFREVEMMQYAYQEEGFNPDWDMDPYKVFVYTTLQEKATQVTHMNTGKLGGIDEPVLRGILSSIAADEAKHFTFYRNVFKAILALDPNRALESALAILPAVEMPGSSMPKFREMSDVIRRIGIYGPWDYKAIAEDAIKYWKIETLTGLSEAGRIAQEKIMSIPDRIRRIAEMMERRSQMKSFSFDFIYDRIFTLE